MFKIEVHGNVTTALLDHLTARTNAALDQHTQRVRRVVVRLKDENGPRGGIDQRCLMQVHLGAGGVVRIDQVDGDMYAAISMAAERAKHVVGRLVARQRDHGSHRAQARRAA